MLRKMYLVSSEYLNNSKQLRTTPSPTLVTKIPSKSASPKNKRVRKKKKTRHLYDKWFEMREADVNRKTLLRTITDFVQKILLSNTLIFRSILVINSRKGPSRHLHHGGLLIPTHAKLFRNTVIFTGHRCDRKGKTR